MQENVSSVKYKTTRSIRIACGFIFIVFSACYLLFQNPLLEMLQKVLSDGQTSYSAKWGTWIIILVLCLIQFGVSYLSRLPERCHALSYAPSLLILAFITDIHSDIYSEISLGRWGWMLPLGIVSYASLAWLCRQAYDFIEGNSKKKWHERFLPNILILYFLCVGCMSLGNTDEVFHYETAADAAILKHDYEEALSVGKESRSTSRELTVMRTYALSRMDSLPEQLFQYPQYDASRGLMFNTEDRQTTWLRKETIYNYLGGVPKEGESIVSYLKRLCYTETGNEPALDYYLCALLLRKELDEFAKELKSFCYVDSLLPKAYQEALYLYYKKHPVSQLPFDMTNLEVTYEKYQSSPEECWKNYWYYYDHMTIRYEK